MFGINFDYIADRSGTLLFRNSHKTNVLTSCIYGSLFVNPYHFKRETSLSTTAIGIRVGIIGYIQREK